MILSSASEFEPPRDAPAADALSFSARARSSAGFTSLRVVVGLLQPRARRDPSVPEARQREGHALASSLPDRRGPLGGRCFAVTRASRSSARSRWWSRGARLRAPRDRSCEPRGVPRRLEVVRQAQVLLKIAAAPARPSGATTAAKIGTACAARRASDRAPPGVPCPSTFPARSGTARSRHQPPFCRSSRRGRACARRRRRRRLTRAATAAGPELLEREPRGPRERSCPSRPAGGDARDELVVADLRDEVEELALHLHRLVRVELPRPAPLHGLPCAPRRLPVEPRWTIRPAARAVIEISRRCFAS